MTDDLVPILQLLEAASWRLAAELLRRSPARLRLIETHPGGGQYDCLTLLDRAHLGDGEAVGSLYLNRVGRAHVFSRFDGTPLDLPANDGGPISFEVWPALMAAEDPRDVVRDVAARAGLPPLRSLARVGSVRVALASASSNENGI